MSLQRKRTPGSRQHSQRAHRLGWRFHGGCDVRHDAPLCRAAIIAWHVQLNPWLVLFSRFDAYGRLHLPSSAPQSQRRAGDICPKCPRTNCRRRKGVAHLTSFHVRDLWKQDITQFDAVALFAVQVPGHTCQTRVNPRAPAVVRLRDSQGTRSSSCLVVSSVSCCPPLTYRIPSDCAENDARPREEV